MLTDAELDRLVAECRDRVDRCGRIDAGPRQTGRWANDANQGDIDRSRLLAAVVEMRERTRLTEEEAVELEKLWNRPGVWGKQPATQWLFRLIDRLTGRTP